MGRRATGHGPRLPASRPHADRAGRQQAASGFNDWLSAKPDEHVKQGLASLGK